MLPFFFNDTATTEIYTLSLHDALPICAARVAAARAARLPVDVHEDRHDRHAGGGDRRRPPEHRGAGGERIWRAARGGARRTGEHTSELQARQNIVCRLLPEKKKKSAVS